MNLDYIGSIVVGKRADLVLTSSGGDAGDQGGVDYGGGEDGVEVRGSAGTSDAAGC